RKITLADMHAVHTQSLTLGGSGDIHAVVNHEKWSALQRKCAQNLTDGAAQCKNLTGTRRLCPQLQESDSALDGLGDGGEHAAVKRRNVLGTDHEIRRQALLNEQRSGTRLTEFRMQLFQHRALPFCWSCGCKCRGRGKRR